MESRYSRTINASVYGICIASLAVSGAVILGEVFPFIKYELQSYIFNSWLGIIILASLCFVVTSFIVYLIEKDVDETATGRALSAFAWLLVAMLIAVGVYFILQVFL